MNYKIHGGTRIGKVPQEDDDQFIAFFVSLRAIAQTPDGYICETSVGTHERLNLLSDEQFNIVCENALEDLRETIERRKKARALAQKGVVVPDASYGQNPEQHVPN